MSISLRDLADQPHLRLNVLAGAGGLDRTVSWAHASDLPEPWDWLAGGELLMKNGRTLPRSASGQARLLESLASAGVSALVVGSDPATPPISARAVAVANALTLPLMLVPYAVSFIAISRAVADASLQEESQRLVRAERIYAAIQEDAAGADPRAFLARLERELGCSLWVLDAGSGQAVLDGTLEPEEGLRAALLSVLARRAAGAVPGLLRLPARAPGAASAGGPARPAALAVEVPYEEPTLLVAQPRDDRPLDLSLLQHAATAVAVGLAHASLRQDYQRHLGASLLAQLLDSRLDAIEAERQLAAHGIVAGRARLLAANGADEDSQRRLRIGLRRRRISHLLLRRAPVVLVLLAAGPSGPPVDVVAGRLGPAATVGVSNVLGTPLGVPDAAREAMWALGAAARRPERLAYYGEATPLPVLRDPAEAQALVDRTLGTLLEYDRSSGADLVRSLAVFLACRRSWQATARQLNIHRQTVIYRMQRVSQLTGRTLTDTADIAELWLALSALDLLTGDPVLPGLPRPR